MTNSNLSKMIPKSTNANLYSSSQVTNSQKNHSRVVKSSMYYQSSVIPSRGKHRQTESRSVETPEKKVKTKPVDKNYNNGPSPTTVRQVGSTNLKQQRVSPSKEGNLSSSPLGNCFYAGAKFSEPPTPNALPKPPMHWTSLRMTSGGAFPLLATGRAEKCHGVTSNLKLLLNVPA